jgi:hypothetical protein
MSSCKDKLVTLLSRAVSTGRRTRKASIEKLARELAEHPDLRMRAWTVNRLAITLMVIEDLYRGHRCERLITLWFVPARRFVESIEKQRASRPATESFRRFARIHHL